MSGGTLAQRLRAFDDAALTALASKGLLRRAERDLAAGKVVLLEVGDDGAKVDADGDTVHIGPDGPAVASCTCRAPGVCRHRLAATLALREDAEPSVVATPGDRPESGDGAETEPVTATESDPLAEIMALSPVAIAKWAGKATLRAAEEMTQASPDPTIRIDGGSIVVRLDEAALDVRYLAGQGLDGMISKAPRAKRKALQVAAILAIRRRHGATDASPGPEQQEPADAADVTVLDPTFLAQVVRCLTECVRTGFNQAPAALEERLFALSVSSRADALPRLSAMLRTIAARVREKRDQDFSLDLDGYLALVAEAYALAQALHNQTDAAEDAPALATLKGQVRQDYLPAGRLTLFGLGANSWHTAAGARGVTGYFYAPEQNRWYSAGIARGHGHDATFSPGQAYAQESLWGAGALAKLSRSKVVIEGAAATADGRLSHSKDISATASAWPSRREDVDDWPTAIRDWRRLESDLQERFRPGLSRPRPGPQPVILLPAAVAKPSFDELAQETIWPVQDDEGTWIGLTLSHGGGSSDAGNLEGILRTERPWAIAALATPERHGFDLKPFALFLPSGEDGCHNIALDPAHNAGTQRPGKLLRRLRREAASVFGADAESMSWSQPAGATGRLLAETGDALLGIAEMGGIASEIDLDQFKAFENTCETCGLEPIAVALNRLAAADRQSVPARLLECAYLVSGAQTLIKPLRTLRHR